MTSAMQNLNVNIEKNNYMENFHHVIKTVNVSTNYLWTQI